MLSLAVSGSSLPCHNLHTKSSTLTEPGHTFISSLRTDFCIMDIFTPISAMTSDLSVLSGCPQVGQQGASHIVKVPYIFHILDRQHPEVLRDIALQCVKCLACPATLDYLLADALVI